MMRSVMAVAIGLFACVSLAAAPAQDQGVTYINLQAHANHKLADNFHSGTEGNHLGSLPKGKQTFEGAKFLVEDGLIQLGSKILGEKPERVDGIKVDKAFEKLHFLHATGYGGGPNKEGSQLFVADDTVIGKYVVHYEDKSKEEIDIVYGKHVRDWWFVDGEKEVSGGKVAWKGENDATKNFMCGVRVYLTTWKNPKPDKKVVSIDYLSAGGVAAPFCIAMTAEGK